jgi:hypothetical protein
MLKIIYIIMVVLYTAIITCWFYRYEISYRLTGGDYSLVENKDLTMAELDGFERAYVVRTSINNILLYSSIALVLGNYGLRDRLWQRSRGFVKCITYVAAFIALILVLVHGIDFVSMPPVR